MAHPALTHAHTAAVLIASLPPPISVTALSARRASGFSRPRISRMLRLTASTRIESKLFVARIGTSQTRASAMILKSFGACLSPRWHRGGSRIAGRSYSSLLYSFESIHSNAGSFLVFSAFHHRAAPSLAAIITSTRARRAAGESFMVRRWTSSAAACPVNRPGKLAGA